MRLNCWLVAMWLWIHSRGKGGAYVTRSHSFKGLIPHFGFVQILGWRYARVTEYVPPHRRRWSKDDVVLLFKGKYRVTHYRLVAVRRHDTLAAAMADYFWNFKEH